MAEKNTMKQDLQEELWEETDGEADGEADEETFREELALSVLVPEDVSPVRIDKYLSDCPQLLERSLTRSHIQKLIQEGFATIREKPVKSSYKVQGGEEITLLVPAPEPVDILPENIPLDILYEDEELLVVNKPKGMVVHPAAGHYSGTLVNAVLYHCGGKLSGINGIQRPGIVHRIDRDTTGALLVCKTDLAHQKLAVQLKEHTIKRRYRAIVKGTFQENEGTVDAPIGRHPVDRKRMAINHKNGKNAVTHYKVLEQFRDCAYIECRLETGRTHQIRVHMASLGHPLLGDEVYGNGKSDREKGLQGQTLHAMVLGFVHPVTEEYMEFTAPLPGYFQDLLEKLSHPVSR